MKIVRIDSDRLINQDIERIEIEIGEDKYTLTNRHGELKIHAHDGCIVVNPLCANEIAVKGGE